MSTKNKRFLVYCGDTYGLIPYNRKQPWSQERLKEKFNSELKKYSEKFFPGLILEDGKGDLWVPELTVKFKKRKKK